MNEIIAMIKYTLFWVFLRITKLKFYAAQDNKMINNGYEIWSLKKNSDAYFYGTTKEFEEFHAIVRGK